jgi:hypothetical protein
MAFTLKSGNQDGGPYGDKTEATAGVAAEGKSLTDQGYVKSGGLVETGNTISQDYTKTTKPTYNMKKLPLDSDALWKRAQDGGYVLKGETRDEYMIRAREEMKGTTDKKTVSGSWPDGLDLDLGDGEIPPPPGINVPVDPSGMPEGSETDAVNTKLGDLDEKLEGRTSNVRKRKEESTALDAEGFDAKGTPLKTRGIANKDWGLA